MRKISSCILFDEGTLSNPPQEGIHHKIYSHIKKLGFGAILQSKMSTEILPSHLNTLHTINHKMSFDPLSAPPFLNIHIGQT